MIARGFIFFPPLRVRSPEEKQALIDAEAKKDQERLARQEAEQQAQRAAAEQGRLIAEQIAKQQADERTRQEAQLKARIDAANAAQAKAEEAVRKLAEQRAQQQAEYLARRQAAEKAKAEVEEAARKLAEQRAQQQAEDLARSQAAEKAKAQAEEAARKLAEQRAQQQAEDLAQRQAAEKAKAEAEEAARKLAEQRAQQQAEDLARKQAVEKAKAEAEEAVRRLAEQRAQQQAEDLARRQAAEKAKAEAEEAARRLAEQRARQEAEDLARKQAAEKAKADAEEAAHRLAEQRARQEAEDLARQQAAEKAKAEAEEAARKLAEQRAQQQAEDLARRQAAEKAKAEAEEAARKLAEQRARQEAEELARRQAAEKAKAEAEEAARKLAEQRARQEAEDLARRQAAEQATSEAEEITGKLAEERAQLVVTGTNPEGITASSNETQTITPVQSSQGAVTKLTLKEGSPIDPKAGKLFSTVQNLAQGRLNVDLGKEKLAISPQSLTYSKQEGPTSKFSIGIESGGSGRAVSIRSSAAALFDSALVGAYLNSKRNESEIGANAVIDLERFFLRGSLGYQFGRKEYDFFAGRAAVHVAQYSGLLGLGIATDFDYLNAISLKAWQSQGRQRELLSPAKVIKETDTSIDTYVDQRLLSEGRLNGWSFAAQGQLLESLNYKASLGSESLLHPYSDGTSSLLRKNYFDFSMDYFLSGNSRIGLTLRQGVTGKRYGARLGQPGWTLFVENDKAYDYGIDAWRVGVSFNLGQPIYKTSNLSSRSVKWTLLSEAGSIDRKPNEFPSGFLLKVDPTAISLISRIMKGTINWLVSGSLGDFHDSLPPTRTAVSIQLAAVNTAGYPVEFSPTLFSGSLPAGLVLSTSGLISGSANVVQSDTESTFRVIAKSPGAADSISPPLRINIRSPKSITWQSSGTLGTFNEIATPSRTSISIQLSATSNTGNAVTYATTLAEGSFPPGLSLSNTGVISGTALHVAQDTSYDFKVKASSTGASDSISPALRIVIKAPQLLTWNSTGTIATLNDSTAPSRLNVNLQLNTTSSDGSAVVYDTIPISGALPPGLTLSQTGLLTGTIPAVATETNYDFVVAARSASISQTNSGTLRIVVKPRATISWTSAGTLASRQNCNLGNYGIQLIASSSDSSAVSYELNSGTLPPGATLSSTGMIQGVPQPVNSNSDYVFTVKASSPGADSVVSSQLKISVETGGVYYNSSNGHYYKPVAASGMTWAAASNMASTQVCNGYGGYLATITTNQELNFIDQVVYPGIKPDNIFIGASDAASHGNWRWVTGPEGQMDGGQGVLFYTGAGNGQSVNGYIAPWYSKSALDQTGHNYAFIYSFFMPKFNPWNGSLGSPASGGMGGYLIEFGE